MKTILNMQNATHNAKEYAPPQITIVEFNVEHCFVSTTEFGQTNARWWNKWDDDNYSYSTGSEEISDCTNSSGNFSTGGWR